ncbi:hypothetical protein A1O7_03573 [Cladophialophora yegresii CBS 114405]|uniref:Uncharacterized protein n=1 Tax=Cladophialophora yegresii CBS 114405 TaxID=1182544 RepID=W9W592_9EURO|nr:uncharacterized protein A1O7_03573 [Cladophialophora yegresii CBS 114405]EXJ63128.1 hypothetical protein A1O7_03573 [Cladophialophora yegresii CBS 114405]
MASQRVQTQLSKPLALNAENIVVSPPAPISNILPNPPNQPAFPTYSMDYRAGIKVVRQAIPARPADGQGTHHTYHMATHSNLHPLLLQMEPAPNPFAGVIVPDLIDDATNQLVLGNDGTPLRYFSHLPRWVEYDVSGMLIELWMRLDQRVEMRDILNRINAHPTKKLIGSSGYNMKRSRFREAIDVPPFTMGRQHPSSFEIDVINNQTREQLLLNTCMLVDIPNICMFKPVMASDRVIHGYVDSRLPLDYFLRGFPTPIPIPSDRQNIALQLRMRLQTLAIRRNLGDRPQTYKYLPENLKPTWWQKSPVSQGPLPIRQLDNLTHNEWIAQLCRQFPGMSRSGTSRTSPSSPAHADQPALVPMPSPVAFGPSAQQASRPQTPRAPPAPVAPQPAIDQDLENPARPLAGEWHERNSDDGISYYVEPAHRRPDRRI